MTIVIVNFEHISQLFLVFLLLTLNKKMLAGYTRVFNRPGVGTSWRLGERVAKKTLIILLGVCDGSANFEKLKLKNYYSFIILKNPLNAVFF